MAENRTKRVPAVSARRAGAQKGLEALMAAREGGSKRVNTYEFKEEKPVYDVVDEEEYVQLVAKRRDAGDFIVDDDGQGYADLGEEDHHWKDEEEVEDGEEADAGAAKGSKKRKADKDAGKGKAKKGSDAAGASGPAAGSGNIAQMFSKATARAAIGGPSRAARASAAQPAEDTDALLSDILGGLGGADEGPAPVLPSRPVAPGPSGRVLSARGPPRAPAAGSLGGQGRLGGGGGMVARPAPVRPLGTAAGAVSGRHGPLFGGQATTGPPAAGHTPPSAVQSQLGSAARQLAHASEPEPVQDMEEEAWGEDGGDDCMDAAEAEPIEATEAAADADESMAQQEPEPDSTTLPEPSGDGAPAEVVRPGVGAVVTERSTAAAAGWQSMYTDDQEEVVGIAAAPASPAPAAVATGGAGASGGTGPLLVMDAEGGVPFYFLDAYENAEQRPGEVILFGKVHVSGARGQWASACAVVQNCQRSVLVVPRPEVFADADGEIAKLEGGMAEALATVTASKAAAAKSEAEVTRWAAAAVKLQAEGAKLQAGSVEGVAEEVAEEAQIKSAAATAAVTARAEDALAKSAAATVAAAEAVATGTKAGVDGDAQRLQLIKLLQVKSTEVKAELRDLLKQAGVHNFRIVPVKRAYAFENTEVQRGEQWVLKVRYSAGGPSLPPTTTGRTFVALFGAATPCLEALLIKRRVKGPCWLRLVGAARVEYGNQLSWCKVELNLGSPKSVLADPLHPAIANRAAPPITVASISLKTVINPSNHQHEVAAAAVVYLDQSVDIEAPMALEKWNKPKVLRNFCVVRKLDSGRPWPATFEDAVAQENNSPRGRANGGNMLQLASSERTLLTTLLNRMQALDADVLVGHNISAFDLSVLLSRMQHHKVPMWSRIGRLKRGSFPKLTGGGHAYGGGASAGALAAIAGRVLCDTYLSARELVKEVDFTLSTLAKSLLNQDRGDLSPSDVPARYETAQGLLSLVRHGESDAWLALGLMFNLSVLPLTRALSALSGSLWSKTLQGARAQRIEMLLLHEFHSRKFVLPDKAPYSKTRGKGQPVAVEEEPMGQEEEGEAEEGAKPLTKPGKANGKGPQYAGGLVLEPKKGLYDKLVIMLDFNSLYPSIIQEFNICFSTVIRPTDGSMPALPPAPAPGTGLAPLPMILQGLVQRRRQAKTAMANARDPITKQQLNIRQQALKLTANSMYGCLGFTSSRFYARPLAELITSQGRSILQSTVDLVQNTIGAEVIYGDTDSIMINTGILDLLAAKELGQRIKREVNKRYKLLEIELDAIFKCMLLLKKKKYASIKLEPQNNGTMLEVPEMKGLDIVRRDWCGLCKDAGHAVLAAILSGQPRDEVVEACHETLRNVRAAVLAGTVPLGKFIITKQLTKKLDEYSDSKSQPHVQVALRRRASGRRDGINPGDTVPYIICVEQTPPTPAQDPTHPSATPPRTGPAQVEPSAQGTPSAAAGAEGNTTPGRVHATSAPGNLPGSEAPTTAPPHIPTHRGGATGVGLADRAYHPDELLSSGGRLVIDAEYYLGQQVHPVVARLVGVLEGTDAGRLAECLGLDPGRFRGPTNANQGQGQAEGDAFGGSLLEDDEQYKDCDALQLIAPGDAGSGAFAFRGALEVAKGTISAEQLLAPPHAVGDPTATLTPAQLANQVVLRAREAVSRYYDGLMDADDEMACNTEETANNHAGDLRDVVLRACGEVDRCSHPDTTRHAGVLLARHLGERQLYLQLTHYHRLLNPEAAVRRGLAQIKAADPRSGLTEADVRSRLAPVAIALRAACDALEAIRAQSGYHWVDTGALFGVMATRSAALQTSQ